MPDLLKRSPPARPPKATVPSKPSPAPKARTVSSRRVPEVSAKSDGYIPFRDRFRAWWDGVEPEALVRKGQKARTSQTRRIIELDSIADLPPESDWGAARVRVCDQVWGYGFVGPGGATYAVEMARPFSARAEAAVLDLSVGLGGRISEIARDTAVTVTGVERDEEFAEHALERAKAVDQRNVRSVHHFNPDRLSLSGMRYDCILAREMFFTVSDKLALLGTLRNGLRKNGSLAFTDFVLAEPDQNEGAVMAQWHETEPVLPEPWSLSEYQMRLEGLSLNVLEFVDDSQNYRDQVLRAWREYVDNLETVTFDRTLVDALMQEAELWLHRVRAIESGQLRVLRVLARLRSGPL